MQGHRVSAAKGTKMSSTALKVFAAIAVLAAVVLAMIGYRMSRSYAQKSERAQQQAQQPSTEVLAVVAVKPLAAYQPIARDAVALVPVAVQPGDPYTTIDEVVGKAPLVDIDAGAPVTHRYFRDGNLLARAIPPGFQAVSISVTDVLAVGGFLRPGDIVDVLIYLRGTDATDKPQSRVLLEKVRVLAYLEDLVDRPQGVDPKADERAQRQQRTAVLAIAEKDTTRLMLGASLGELRLALRGQNDGTQIAVTDGNADGGTGSAAASVSATDRARLEKVITAEELGRIRPPPGAAAPSARIEVIRGNDRSAVTTK